MIFWFQGGFEDTRILPGFGTRNPDIAKENLARGHPE